MGLLPRLSTSPREHLAFIEKNAGCFVNGACATMKTAMATVVAETNALILHFHDSPLGIRRIRL